MSDIKPIYKLYSPRNVGLATFFGSALGGAIAMALNYRSLGQPTTAWKCLGIGVVLAVLELALWLNAPKGLPWIFVLVLEIFVAYYIAKKLQGRAFEEHILRGGAAISGWSAFAIGFLMRLFSVLILMGSVIVNFFLHPGPETKALQYDRQGQHQEAMSEWNKAVKSDPERYGVYSGRATTYEQLGQYENAVDDWNKAISLFPTGELAYCRRAFDYEKLGQYKKAINDCDKALKIKPWLATNVAYLIRGTSYAKTGQYQKAIDDCNKIAGHEYKLALEINQYGDAYFIRGMSYEKLGQQQKAVDDYNHAIDKYNLYLGTELPTRARVIANKHDNHSSADIRSGEYQSAIDEAIHLDPDFASAYYHRGQAYKKLGKHDLAKRDLEEAQKFGYTPEQE